MTQKFRSPYDYDLKAASEEAAYIETMPSLTNQAHTEDSDLNILMVRFGVTGKMPENVRLPRYGDFTHVTDYRSAIEATRLAEDSFMEFPADVRARFENNPQYFLDFVENPANIEQVKKWFPKENLNAEVRNNNAPSGAIASSSSVAPAAGGAGAPSGDGGAAVSK